MLELEQHVKLNLASIQSPNLCDRLSDQDLTLIANICREGFDADVSSRSNWVRRNEAGMDLAMQVVEAKSFPWPGCANIAFPLITIAVMQFHSRAYPELIPGKELVKYEVWGNDPQGKESQRAERVETHMSYQCLKEDAGWEEAHDKLLLNYSVVGSAFTKVHRSVDEQINKSEFVPARYLVMDYWSKSVESAARKTHVIPLTRNQITSRVRNELFRDILEEPWFTAPAQQPTQQASPRADKRAGISTPVSDQLTPFWFGEQHTYLDLDGDGYAEPVIVTFDLNSSSIVRIVYRFDREEDITRTPSKEITYIRPTEYFTGYEFIPSPDGGAYGLGWGILLGPINETVSSGINQMLDAGTLYVTGGGFLARGAKIKGGAITFAPNQWHNVDCAAGQLKDSIVANPVREPSQVMFELLGMLIDYANRIASATEMLVGDNPGQNTPAATSAAMVEQGMKIFAAIFKRAWRSMKQEFEKLYMLNSIHMPRREPLPGDLASWADYAGDPTRVQPSADPTVLSEQQRLNKAMAVKQAAMTTPGYDMEAVERNFLRALRVPNWQSLYKGPKNVPPLPNPKVQIEEMRLKAREAEMKQEQSQFILEMMEEKRVNDAKILELEAKAALEVEEAGGVKSGHQIAAFEAAIGALKLHSDTLFRKIELMQERMALDAKSSDAGRGNGVAGAPNHPAPTGMGAGDSGGLQGPMGGGGIQSTLQ